MNFYNKYKDLFDVSQTIQVPKTKLKIDNELFIEKPYIGTYKQEFSLSNKLKQMKKDYSSFENEIIELNQNKITPKRSVSRRKKQDKSNIFSKKAHQQNIQFQNPRNQKLPKQNFWQKEKKNNLSNSIKRQSWLRSEQDNILKHSQLDHIFNERLKKQKIMEPEDIRQHVLPRVDFSPINHQPTSPYSRPPKQNNFYVKQKSRVKLNDNKKERQQPSVPREKQDARERRQKAKNNLEFRRKKLEQLLRTMC